MMPYFKNVMKKLGINFLSYFDCLGNNFVELMFSVVDKVTQIGTVGSDILDMTNILQLFQAFCDIFKKT